jgi:tetratricopeptide (TPR) repeat protein
VNKKLIYISFFLFFVFNYSFSKPAKPSSEFQLLETETKEIEFRANFIEANKQKMLGNFSDAINLYLASLELKPESATSMFEIARILYTNKDYTGALQLMESAVDIESENIWFLFFINELYKETSNFKKALKVSDKLIKLDQYNEFVYFDRINILMRIGKINAAEKEFDRIEKIFGESSVVVEEKIKFYFQTNQIKKAESTLLELSKLYPENDVYLKILSDFYLQQKNYNKALDILNDLLKITSDTSSIHLSKAEIFLDKGDYDNFINEFFYVLKDPFIDVNTKIEVVNSLLEDSVNINQYQEEFAKILYDIHPNSLEVRAFYANYLTNNNQQEDALQHLYYILNEDDKNLSVYNQLLYIEHNRQNWDSVISISSRAIEYYPNQYFLFFYKGFALFMCEMYDDAINTFMLGINFSPTNEVKSEFYYYIAESYYKSDNSKMSYHFFERSLSSFPNNPIVLNNYSFYLSLANENLDRALEMTKLSNELEPNSAIYLDTYAWVLFKLGKFDEAKIIIEKAISFMDEENGEILEHYGDILFKLNDIDNALVQWNKAVDKDGVSEFILKKIELKQIVE